MSSRRFAFPLQRGSLLKSRSARCHESGSDPALLRPYGPVRAAAISRRSPAGAGRWKAINTVTHSFYDGCFITGFIKDKPNHFAWIIRYKETFFPPSSCSKRTWQSMRPSCLKMWVARENTSKGKRSCDAFRDKIIVTLRLRREERLHYLNKTQIITS